MLIHFGIVPYLVFDGDYLPSKSATEAERASKREEHRKLGLELHRMGKISQAQNELQKAVDVTPQMARQLIEVLKQHGVQYIVAPYEADAQLAYLEREGIISGILSEDSDLLVFGAKCLLTKLDQYGDCIEINRDDFTACREISLVGWSDREFRLMAILSGCDYLASIDKMGLKTAYRLVRKYKHIEKILRMLAFDGKYNIPPGYLESFRKAELTFLHQRVFCPHLNDMVMMTSLGTRPEPDDFAFIGAHVVRDIAIGVARGDLNPMTKEPIIVGDRVRRLPKTPVSYLESQSAVKFSDLKCNRSIESFFKVRRTPLAELDPNSFTPSPSQQRLLRTANTTWMSDLAPNRQSLPQQGTLTGGFATPSAPASGATIARRVGQSQPLSKPFKRRRLCVEAEGEGDTQEQSAHEESRSSRFFGSLPEPSPSVRTKESKKLGKRAEVNIWSDDSIEDAMAGLPDLSECHEGVKEGKLKIFRDDVLKADTNLLSLAPMHKIQEDSQSSSVSTTKTQSHTSLSTSFIVCSESSQLPAQSQGDNASTERASLSKFSYQPHSQGGLLQGGNAGRKQQNARSLMNLTTKAQPERKRSMTPLERLGAGALSRSHSFTKLANNTLDIPSTLGSMKNTPDHPETSSDLPAIKQVLCRTRGSEDQIIPDSEDDDDSNASETESKSLQRKAKPDLARFVFVA
jgi:exonuclease-1